MPGRAADFGNTAALADFAAFFGSVRMLPVTAAVWDRCGADSRRSSFRAMDALHLATAVEHGCGGS